MKYETDRILEVLKNLESEVVKTTSLKTLNYQQMRVRISNFMHNDTGTPWLKCFAESSKIIQDLVNNQLLIERLATIEDNIHEIEGFDDFDEWVDYMGFGEIPIIYEINNENDYNSKYFTQNIKK